MTTAEVTRDDVTAETSETNGAAGPTSLLLDSYKLAHPVHFGEELIDVLTLRPSGLAMKGFKVVTTGDGGLEFEPYRFAELGLRLAGKPRAIVDRMHPCDQFGLGMVALGFTMRGPEIGKTLSL
jgi:hypothetical protein